MSTDNTLNTAAVAALLAEELGGKVALWTTWLTNDRRPGRANELMPISGPGRPRYLRTEVGDFIAANRARRLRDTGPSGRVAEVLKAVGIGEEGGSPTGRRLDCQVSAQVDEKTLEGFLQLVIASPLLVYRLSPEEARHLAALLLARADDADIDCTDAVLRMTVAVHSVDDRLIKAAKTTAKRGKK